MKNLDCLLYVLIFFLFSCSDNYSGSPQVISDSVVQEISIPYHEDSVVFNNRREPFVQNLGKILGLPALAGGTYVIDISGLPLKKECHILQFSTPKNDSGVFVVVHKQWKITRPKSGWNQFFDIANKFQIVHLTSGKNIPDLMTRMAYIQFEIAQPEHYRFYEYLEPAHYRHVEEGSNNVYSFLKYLNDEMEVQVYTPYEKDAVAPAK
jgi:hypothetical protein